MKFTKIIGTIKDTKTQDLVRKAEERLSSVFTELALGYDNKAVGTGVGGDPLVFQLVYPLPHYCDLLSHQLDELEEVEKTHKEKVAKGEEVSSEGEISEDIKRFRAQMRGKVLRTAATDGKRYYWNPKFVLEKDKLGLRIVVAHEAWHAIYMHPGRRGSRIHPLWNIAVDFKVNFTIMQDLKSRDIKDYPQVFTKNLGEYISLKEYADFLKDPFNPPPRLAHLNPIHDLKSMVDPAYKHPGENAPPMYYADHELSDEMKRPENIYDYLLAQVPKCPKCGKLGKYKKPNEYKVLEKKLEEQEKKKQQQQQKKNKDKNKSNDKGDKDHDHGDDGDCCDHDCKGKNQGDPQQNQSGQGDPQDNNDSSGQPQDDGSCCGGSQCPQCGEGGDYVDIDPFGRGQTLDDHIDSDISEEELGKRIFDAMQIAKKMAGKIPGGLEDELGQLIAPKITWQDLVRQQMRKKRNGYGKTDWLRPKSRPMFAGLYIPRKRDYFLNILAAYDCSGSMSAEDIAFGISQLQIIDERGECWLLPWDTVPYFDAMVKIKKLDKENLMNAKRKGLGGTMIGEVFNQYEEHCGKVDIIIIISDGFIGDSELANVKMPPKETSVLWLITSHNPNFKPPIGRVMHLLNE